MRGWIICLAIVTMIAAGLDFTGHLPHYGGEIVGGLFLLTCTLLMLLPNRKPKL